MALNCEGWTRWRCRLPPAPPLPTFAELSAKVLAQTSEEVKPFFEQLFHDDYDVRKHSSFYCTVHPSSWQL